MKEGKKMIMRQYSLFKKMFFENNFYIYNSLNISICINYRCPDKDIMSPFKYNRISGTAEAQLYSMFKFPESNRVHFQCDILVCRGNMIETLYLHKISRN